ARCRRRMSSCGRSWPGGRRCTSSSPTCSRVTGWRSPTMAPRDSNAIDVALQATLLADAALMALVPDGVFFDDAAQGAQRFIIISIVTGRDDTIEVFGGRAVEDALYAIKAV